MTVVPPLLGQIQAEFGMDATTAALLTSIPVLCFGALTPFASWLLRRIGINHGALYCLIAVVVGSAVRSAGGVPTAFVGTTILGVGLTIGNLAISMLIGRQFRNRAELATSGYTAAMNITITIVTAFAVPVAAQTSWQWAAAAGGVGWGLIALGLWVLVYPPGVRGVRAGLRTRAGLPALPPRVRHPSGSKPAPLRPQMRRLAWLLTVAFSGHTLAYYATTAWLPSALADIQQMTAAEAGFAASLFQAFGVIGPLVVPALANLARWSQSKVVALAGLSWLVMPAGILILPSGWAVWSVVAGMAQGAFFTAVVSVVVSRSANLDENRQVTSQVQTIGYCVAATGPVLTGWIHQQVSGWTAPFGLIFALLAAAVAAGWWAVRPQKPASPAPIA